LETILNRSGTPSTQEAEPPSAPAAGIGLDDIRTAINGLVPFQKFVGAHLAQLDAHGAVATLPDAAHLLNHVGTGHAAALYLVAEAAAGAALAGALRERVTTTRFVLRESEICYHRKARGEIRAVAGVPGEKLRARCSQLAVGERFEEAVESLLYDPAGDHVATARFTYHCRILSE
jgi:acyl-coenzyme A thioesterase PaaI-like protein